MVLSISSNGDILKHTQDLKNDQIPSNIINAVSKYYNGYDIRDADLNEENGQKVYTLRMRKSKERIYVTFNKEGAILETR